MRISRLSVFFLFFFITLTIFGNASESLKTGIIAIVNEKVITLQQLNESMQEYRLQLIAENTLSKPSETEIRKEALEKLIEQALIVQEFENKKGKIFDVYLENYVQTLLKEHFEGKREIFLQYLKQKGQTFRQFQQEIKESLIVREMVDQKVKSNNKISPKTIEEYYRANLSQFTKPATIKIQQIVFNVDDRLQKGDFSCSKYNVALEKIHFGASFQDLTEALQEKPTEGIWLEKTEMNPKIAELAFTLDKGKYTEPVPVENRYFIVFLEDKKDQQISPLTKVQDDIENQLLKELNHKAYQAWISRLKEKSFIQYF